MNCKTTLGIRAADNGFVVDIDNSEYVYTDVDEALLHLKRSVMFSYNRLRMTDKEWCMLQEKLEACTPEDPCLVTDGTCPRCATFPSGSGG